MNRSACRRRGSTKGTKEGHLRFPLGDGKRTEKDDSRGGGILPKIKTTTKKKMNSSSHLVNSTSGSLKSRRRKTAHLDRDDLKRILKTGSCSREKM